MSPPTPLLVAVSGPAEAALVTALDGAPDLSVVRRCADLVELLAASAAGHGRVALVSGDLHRFDAVAVASLHDAGTAVVGVRSPSTEDARLSALGVDALLDPDAAPATLAATISAALAAHAGRRATQRPAAAPPTARVLPGAVGRDVSAAQPRDAQPRDAQPRDAQPRDAQPPDGGPPGTGWTPSGAAAVLGDHHAGSRSAAPPPARARVLAVWGCPGAPGRTMVATSLASALAGRGHATLLVDADTTAASVALALGLLDESAGLAAACRSAAEGRLDADRLRALAPTTAPGLRVLTGLPRSSRWPEVGETPLTTVLDVARHDHAFVVVDCASSVEEDEELSYDTRAPLRNAASVTTLRNADEVLVVGAADPVGLQRLVRALADLEDVAPGVPASVVVTQVRASSVGPSPRRQVVQTLARYAGVSDPCLLPDDRGAFDAALLAGRSVVEAGGSSALRRGLLDLAAALDQQPTGRPRGSARGRD